MAKGKRNRGLVTLVIAFLLLLSSYALFQLALIWIRGVLTTLGLSSDTEIYITMVIVGVVIVILVGGYSYRKAIRRIIRV